MSNGSAVPVAHSCKQAPQQASLCSTPGLCDLAHTLACAVVCHSTAAAAACSTVTLSAALHPSCLCCCAVDWQPLSLTHLLLSACCCCCMLCCAGQCAQLLHAVHRHVWQ
jgi:hypothetical protein